MKVRRMIGDVLAARIKDEDQVLMELKTNGNVTWVKPNKMDEAIDIFIDNFNVPEEIQEEFRASMRASKVPMELMEQIFWRDVDRVS